MFLPKFTGLKKVPRKAIALLVVLVVCVGIFFVLPPNNPLKQNIIRLWQTITTPKIDYRFHPASKQTGFALLNENRQSGFRVLIGNTDAPKNPEARFEVDKTWINFALANNFSKNSFKKETKDGKDTVTWENVLDHTDAVYQIVNDGLKESMVLKNASPAETAVKNHMPLTLSFDLTTFGVSPRQNIAGKLTPLFLDKNTKEYRFHLEKPYLVDAKGTRFDALDYELIPQGQSASSVSPLSHLSYLSNLVKPAYGLTVGIGDRYTLRLTLPRDWLADPTRAYPVILDPTVTHNTQTAFATGTLNRVKDEGAADNSPLLTSMYHELPADINTALLFHMNEASGTTAVADSSGNGTNGTSVNSTDVTTSLAGLGNARSFNGTSDSISFTSGNVDNNSYTIELWAKVNALPASGGMMQLVNLGTGYQSIQLGNNWSGRYGFEIASYINTSSSYVASVGTVPNTGQWYHIAAVRDNNASQLMIYINGVLTTTSAITSTAYYSNTSNYIGSNGSGSYYFNGVLDDLRISSIARTPEEIKQDAQRFPYSVYTSPVIDLTSGTSLLTGWTNLTWLAKGINTGGGETPISTNGLVAQWNFNETSGTTASSGGSCGAACNGTLTNFASTASQDQAAGTGWTAANARWGAGALMFSSSASNYVSIGTTGFPSGANARTITGWFKPNGTSLMAFDYGTDAAGQRNSIEADNTTVSIAVNGCQYGVNGLNLGGNWHNFAIVFPSSSTSCNQFLVYLDGVLQSSSILAGSATTVNTVLSYGYIGKTGAASNNYYNGTLDDFQVYSRALTAAEILANYQAGNIEFQTRTSADNSTWEAWKPVTGETQITSLDGPYQYNTTDTGLVSYWPMDEASGTSVADAKGTNTGTATGTTIVDGKFGKARSFNGTSDVVSIPYSASIDITGTITAEAWFYETTASEGTIVGHSGTNGSVGWELDSRNTGAVCFYLNNTGACSPTYAANMWNHVVGVYNGSNITVYLNGIAGTPTTYSAGTTSVSTRAAIGARDNNGTFTYFFPGKIDEVRVYNTALSAATIFQHWQEGVTGAGFGSGRIGASTDTTTKMEGTGSEKLTLGAPQVDGNTVALWHLDETSGTGAYLKDSSLAMPSLNTGSGADGSCTVLANTNLNTQSCAGRGTADAVNFSVTASTAAGQNQITVSTTPTGLSTGDEILIINAQGTAGNNTNVGQYETKTISSISVNTLTLNTNLQYSYDGTTQKIIVQRIPNYTSVTVNNTFTLTASAWDGSKGGVLFFRATGTVTNNGTIDMTGKGFRGGNTGSTHESYSTNTAPYTGESFTGPSLANYSSSNGGGGSGGVANNLEGMTGGYGGSFGGIGSVPASAYTTWNPPQYGSRGQIYGNSNLNNLYFGSGGGEGSNPYGTGTYSQTTGQPPPYGSGGIGGGIIFISANTLTNSSGIIQANGSSGGNGYLAVNDASHISGGGGGGGSGGSIYLAASTATLGTNAISNLGGSGGTSTATTYGGWSTAPNGGSGGVGRTAIYSTTQTGSSANIGSLFPNYGTPTGTTVVDGFYGKARSFTSASDTISLPITGVTTTGGANNTISFWVYRTANTNNVYLQFGNPINNYMFYINYNGNCTGFNTQNADVYGTSTAIPLNQWVHLALVINNGNPSGNNKIYVNGVSQTMAYCVGSASASKTIGTTLLIPTNVNPFIIDELKVDNVTRTDEEIAEAYRAGRDHRIGTTIASTDLSAKTKIPFYVAADRPGRFLEATIGNNPYVNYEPDANTVGLWHLEEQTGSGAYVKDSSGYGNNGTPTGTTFVQGKIGKARSFNGSTDYINISNSTSLNITGNFTLDAWVKSTGNSNYGYIVGKADTSDLNGYDITIAQSTGYPSVYSLQGAAYQTTACAKNILNDNMWHYVTGLYDGTNLKIYLDGILCNTVAASSPTSNSSPVRIGASNYTNRFLAGTIDEARISNVARSAADIRAAYEIGRRTHPINIDFVSSPQAAYSSGTSVTINNPYGTTALTNTLSVGDTIIFKENVNGTETVSQAVVNAITNTSTTYGTVTLASAPTFPSGGYSTNAKVFKWQREYFDITGSLGSQRNAVTRITLRDNDGSQGANVWLDDFRYNTNYMNSQTPASFDTATGIGTYTNTGITSTLNRYVQYRAILSSWDTPVSSQLTSAAINYTTNTSPNAPTISAPANGASGVSNPPAITLSATDPENDYLRYKIQACTDSGFTLNCQTLDQTASQTGWSGQDTQTGTAYLSGSTATYTIQSALSEQTTYYLRAYAIDPGGSNIWSSASATVSFTTACNSNRGASACRMRMQGLRLQGIQVK